jgi:predicted PhzF superfamily epimerase YddE/YHI9
MTTFKAVRTDRELECPEIDAGLRALGCELVLLADGVGEDALIAALSDAEPRAGEAQNFYVVWVDPGAGQARARMFSVVVPGGEDPATGSAAGPLGAYLAENAGCERVAIRQGEEMGRPSLLEVEMVDERPRVGGGVIPVIDGEVSLPS